MARCPFCQQGTLRIIAAITQGEVIRKILQHLKLSADPPPIAAAHVRQGVFAWSSTCPRLGYRSPSPAGWRMGATEPLSAPGPAMLPLPVRGWGGMAVLRARPAAARVPPPLPWPRPARHAFERGSRYDNARCPIVCTRLRSAAGLRVCQSVVNRHLMPAPWQQLPAVCPSLRCCGPELAACVVHCAPGGRPARRPHEQPALGGTPRGDTGEVRGE